MPVNPSLLELYQGIILEHSAKPRNCGALPGATHQASLDNPLCGDTVTIYLKVADALPVADAAQAPPAELRIVMAHFEGEGCAIARASASLLTTMVDGKTPAQARALAAELSRFLSTKPPAPHKADSTTESFPLLGELVAMQGLRSFPSRRRCATLAWEALVAALKT